MTLAALTMITAAAHHETSQTVVATCAYGNIEAGQTPPKTKVGGSLMIPVTSREERILWKGFLFPPTLYELLYTTYNCIEKLSI